LSTHLGLYERLICVDMSFRLYMLWVFPQLLHRFFLCFFLLLQHFQVIFRHLLIIETKAKNTEGVPPKKQTRPKPTLKPTLVGDLGDLGNLGDFLKTVQEAEAQTTYTFEQNKRYYVDDHYFQTLVLLKNAGRIRNISALINTLIGQFIETHQTDIEQILQKKER
jgi:hypothetical protein